MAFIKREHFSIGDKVELYSEHHNIYGTLEAGSIVTITGLTEDGYNVADDEGNTMSGLGFDIGKLVSKQPEIEDIINTINTNSVKTTNASTDDIIKIKRAKTEHLEYLEYMLKQMIDEKSVDDNEYQYVLNVHDIINTEITLRSITNNNSTGVFDKNMKPILPGDILKDRYHSRIVIDTFGTYIPASYSYHPYGASNLTAHYPLYDIVNKQTYVIENYEKIEQQE